MLLLWKGFLGPWAGKLAKKNYNKKPFSSCQNMIIMWLLTWVRRTTTRHCGFKDGLPAPWLQYAKWNWIPHTHTHYTKMLSVPPSGDVPHYSAYHSLQGGDNQTGLSEGSDLFHSDQQRRWIRAPSHRGGQTSLSLSRRLCRQTDYSLWNHLFCKPGVTLFSAERDFAHITHYYLCVVLPIISTINDSTVLATMTAMMSLRQHSKNDDRRGQESCCGPAHGLAPGMSVHCVHTHATSGEDVQWVSSQTRE